MQTFLPYKEFYVTARCLDRQRLGKQRIEAKQIYNALDGKSKGWVNHPAVLMWSGHEKALCLYGAMICDEWRQRGYKDQQLEWFLERLGFGPVVFPSWMGNDKFHASHRAALLAKQPDHYKQFEWKEEPVINYWWPTKEGSQ